MKKVIASLIALLMLSACQEAHHQEKAFNDSTLFSQEIAKDVYPKYYEAVSVKKAKKVLPFDLKLPAKLPFTVKNPKVTIGDWAGKKKLSAEVVYRSDEPDNGYIAVHVYNHPNKPSQMISNKAYQKEVTLGGGQEAYLSSTNDNYEALFWKEDQLEYLIEYEDPEGPLPKNAGAQLVSAANSMK